MFTTEDTEDTENIFLLNILINKRLKLCVLCVLCGEPYSFLLALKAAPSTDGPAVLPLADGERFSFQSAAPVVVADVDPSGAG